MKSSLQRNDIPHREHANDDDPTLPGLDLQVQRVVRDRGMHIMPVSASAAIGVGAGAGIGLIAGLPGVIAGALAGGILGAVAGEAAMEMLEAKPDKDRNQP